MGLLELEGVEVVGDGVVGGVLEVCREKERDDDVSDEEALEDTNATACRAGGSLGGEKFANWGVFEGGNLTGEIVQANLFGRHDG